VERVVLVEPTQVVVVVAVAVLILLVEMVAQGLLSFAISALNVAQVEQ
jgi:hypothetical protein